MDVVDMTRYDIGKQIGKGGFGKVYEVSDIVTGEKYAMKVLDKNHHNFFKMKDEVAIQSSFEHPNIVKIEKSFETDNNLVIIMEKCSEELARYEKKVKKIPYKEAMGIFLQIVLAVSYIHQHGYAHRDLKPENIMKCGDTWKLIDFGYAAKEDAKIIGICCTLDFAAPETIYSDIHSPYFGKPTDIWALGIILFEMIYGKTPFYRKTHDATYKAITRSRVVFPEMPEIPEETKELINRMLTKNPTTRVDITHILNYVL